MINFFIIILCERYSADSCVDSDAGYIQWFLLRQLSRHIKLFVGRKVDALGIVTCIWLFWPWQGDFSN